MVLVEKFPLISHITENLDFLYILNVHGNITLGNAFTVYGYIE